MEMGLNVVAYTCDMHGCLAWFTKTWGEPFRVAEL